MATLRDLRPPPRERTFAEVFPWRSIRRALLLVLLIVAIVAIKRSAEPMLARVGQMWGTPVSSPPPRTPERTIHLGPGLAPRFPGPGPVPPSPPPSSQPAR